MLIRKTRLPVTAASDLVSVGNEASKGIAVALMRSARLGTVLLLQVVAKADKAGRDAGKKVWRDPPANAWPQATSAERKAGGAKSFLPSLGPAC